MRRCSKRAARLFRRKPTSPVEHLRESARGCEPSRTPSSRGCRGAARPTPASSGTKAPARTAPQLRRRSKPSTEQARKNMHLCPVGNQPFRSNSPRESARGCEPSRTPSPRGCRGAERPTLASSGTRVSARTAPQLHRRSKPSTEQTRKNMRRRSKRAARLFRQEPKFRLTSRESMCAAVPNALPVCFVGNQPFRSNSPRESARGCEPSRTPSPRGIGERSAPRPRRRKPKFPPEQPHGFVGGRNLRPNRRGRTCAAVPNAPPACFVGNQPFRPNSPGRAREGVNPFVPRHPRGYRGAECPTPASSETKVPARTAPQHRRKPKSSPEHSGRAREGRSPLDFQSRPATCAAERLLAQRASKSLRDRPSEIEDFGWSPPGADFFGVGACPPGEKIASLQIPRPEIRRISAESEKGWCGGESVPSAPRESSRGS